VSLSVLKLVFGSTIKLIKALATSLPCRLATNFADEILVLAFSHRIKILKNDPGEGVSRVFQQAVGKDPWYQIKRRVI